MKRIYLTYIEKILVKDFYEMVDDFECDQFIVFIVGACDEEE